MKFPNKHINKNFKNYYCVPVLKRQNYEYSILKVSFNFIKNIITSILILILNMFYKVQQDVFFYDFKI